MISLRVPRFHCRLENIRVNSQCPLRSNTDISICSSRTPLRARSRHSALQQIFLFDRVVGETDGTIEELSERVSARCSINRRSCLGPSTGTGDFNGDGFSDILWWNSTTGQAVIWLLNGTSVIGAGSPGSAASPWTIVETGDYNSDGMSDILWWNSTTGQVVLWFLNGTSVIGGGSPGSAASPWRVQGMNAD